MSALGILIISPWRVVVLAGTHISPDYVFNPLACTVLALVLAPFAAYTKAQATSARDVHYGELSFIIYLLRFPVLDLVGTGGASYLARLAAMAEVGAVITVGALLIYYLIDQPLNELRSVWVRDRLRRSKSAAADV